MPDALPLVLDTSILLSGRPLPLDRELWVPPRVLEEVTGRGRDRRGVDYALETRLKAREPSPRSRARVAGAARKTGDDARLSPTDTDVIALALDVRGEVLSDDYSVQNVATLLRIPARGHDQRGIRAVWMWTRRCTGCRREVTENVEECPVCGSPVRSARKR